MFLLQKIDTLNAQLKSLLPMKAEDKQRLDKKIRLEFNYNSNHIEGNTLTYGETELLLIFDKTTGNHEMREYEEMKAHDVAFELIKEWAADGERPLSEMAVKNLHETILVRPFWKEAQTPDGQSTRRLIKVGDYKEHPNSVRLQNGEMFHYTSPADTPIQMGELLQWYRDEEEKGELHPVALAALLHYKFVLIHPFDDGNGRLSRLLMNYVLLRNDLPPVIIKSEDKKNYLFALNQADTGNLEAFVEYVGEQVIWSFELYMKAAEGKSLNEPGDLEKKLAVFRKKTNLQLDRQKSMRIISGDDLKLIFQNLHDLMAEWDKNLRLFSDLFLSKKIDVKSNYMAGVIEVRSALMAISVFYRNNVQNHPSIYFDFLSIACVFKSLNTVTSQIDISGGYIEFYFNDIFWLIQYDNKEKPIQKLYNETLTQQEISLIVETMGNKTFELIEQATENNKPN